MQDGKNYGAVDTPRCALGGSRERSSSSQRAALPSCEVKNYEDFLKTKQKRASFKREMSIARGGAVVDFPDFTRGHSLDRKSVV